MIKKVTLTILCKLFLGLGKSTVNLSRYQVSPFSRAATCWCSTNFQGQTTIICNHKKGSWPVGLSLIFLNNLSLKGTYIGKIWCCCNLYKNSFFPKNLVERKASANLLSCSSLFHYVWRTLYATNRHPVKKGVGGFIVYVVSKLTIGNCIEADQFL